MSYNRIILEKKLKGYIEEDCQFTDVSSQFIPEDAISSAKILAKSNGYISGLIEFEILFNSLDIDIKVLKKDGDAVE